MKEYEIVVKYCNACAGAARPETGFDEAQLNSPEEYVRRKHGKEFEQFRKEVLDDGRVVFVFDNGGVSYSYEFTEI